MMIFHLLLLTLSFIITIKAVYNHYKDPYKMKRPYCQSFKLEFKSYPGFSDFMFLFCLIEHNIYDGGLLLANFMKLMETLTEIKKGTIKRINKRSCSENEEIELIETNNLINSQIKTKLKEKNNKNDISQFINPKDIKAMYMGLFTKFGFVEDSLICMNVDNEYENLNLIKCFEKIHQKLDLLRITFEDCYFVKILHQEIINHKEYFL